MDGIKRFTTEYVIPEDRIRLSLESSDGQVRLLWLTRRLCVRLVPQITRVLGQRAKLYSQAAQLPSDNAQRRSQMAALGMLQNHDPVRPEGDVEEHLVTALSMRMNPQAILLDFKTAEDSVIQTVPFHEASMRQWLVMLNAAFRKAQWGDDIWPEWIALKGREDGPDPVRLN
ncbi:MAG: hypothetical protein V2I53_08740 [Paracoccaceae bacterium]|nr:hypothetical protein [Paracoccaceae bacterium]